MDNQKLTQKLADVLNIYHQDPSQRSINHEGRCLYNSGDGRHCVVGHLMPEELKKQGLDIKCNGLGVNALLNEMESLELTSDIVNESNRDLLADLQFLHDGEGYWDKDGISDDGVKRLREHCKTYNLDYTIFEKTLKL